MRKCGCARVATLGPRVLREVSEGALANNCPSGRHCLAAKDLEEAGLARSVATHEAHRVAGAHGERRLHQGEAATDLDAEVAGLEHPSILVDDPATYNASFWSMKAEVVVATDLVKEYGEGAG